MRRLNGKRRIRRIRVVWQRSTARCEKMLFLGLANHFERTLIERVRGQPFLGEILVVVVAGAPGRATQALRAVAPYAEQQRFRRCHLVGHYSVKLFQIGSGEPRFLVILDYQYPEKSELERKIRRVFVQGIG